MRVEDILRRLLGPCVPIHAKRLKRLLTCVAALVSGGRLTLTGLGRHLPTATSHKHAIKAVDRFLGNPHLHEDMAWVCSRIAHKLIGRARRPVVQMDWTGIGDGRYALVAAVPILGRAVPVLFEVHPKEKLANRALQHRFIRRLKEVLPRSCVPIVVADAGFGRPFYAMLDELGWGYVIRVRNTQRRFQYGRVSFKQVLARATDKPIELPDIHENYDSRYRHPDSRFVLAPKPQKRAGRRGRKSRAHQRSAREPWLLVTNLWHHTTREIVRLYATRMQIEECFRDAKSHHLGWGLEDSRSRCVVRLTALLFIGAIASCSVILLGLAAERRGLSRHFQANTSKRRRVLSLHTLGRYVLASHWPDTFGSLDTPRLIAIIRKAVTAGLRPRDNGCCVDMGRFPF